MQSDRVYPDSATFEGPPWVTTWHMVRTMPRLWGSFLVFALLIWRLGEYFGGTDYASLLRGDHPAMAVVQAVGFTLIDVVPNSAASMIVLRALLLDEHRDRFLWEPGDGYGKLLVWSVAQAAVFELIFVAAFASGERGWILVIGLIAAASLTGIVLWQFFQLTPALAVEMPNAGFRQAWQDGRRRVWRYIGASLGAGLRYLAIVLPLGVLVVVTLVVLQTYGFEPTRPVGATWNIGYQWITKTVGLVPLTILMARVQARLFAEAHAA